MKNRAELTVIIPVYNRAQIVERTLKSLEQQTIEYLSIILVDNNSTDNTPFLLKRWADVRRSAYRDITVTCCTTPGATAARNHGFTLATTPYVMFFDSDDVMSSELTATIVNSFHSHPDADIVRWDIDTQLADGTIRHMRFKESAPLLFNVMVHGMLSTQRYAARREIFDRAGLWNESVKVWNDLELSTRLIALHPTIVKLPLHSPVKTYYTKQSITDRHSGANVSPDKEQSLLCCRNNLKPLGLKAVRWADYRITLLAAEYARIGATADSHRLLSIARSAPRLVFRLIYLKHRLSARGTYLFAPFSRR